MELGARSAPNCAIRLVDWSITALMAAMLLSWMTGGIDIQSGPVSLQLYIIHSHGTLLKALFGMVVIRLLVQMQWTDRPFAPFPSWLSAFKRLLELAIAVRIIMVVLEVFHGEIRLPLVRTISPIESLVLIYLMTVIRLLLSRWFGIVILMISVPASVLALLYGAESILRMSQAQALVTHYAQIYTEEAANGEYPISVPADFDPSLNDGRGWTWGHRIVKNDLGFREKRILSPKRPGTFRVMVLGDSLTWGAGLSVRERYTERLNHLIKQRDGGPTVEVLNFGVPGASTVDELRYLQEYHAVVDPDLIVVGFCINDPQPQGQNYSVERKKLHPLYEKVAKLRHLGLQKTYALIISGIDNTLMSLGHLPQWHDALNRVYQPNTREWKDFEAALAGINEISRQRELPPPIFINLTQGIAARSVQHEYIKSWFGKAETAAMKKGFTVADPMPRFIKEMEMSEMNVNPFDSHPSAKANVFYAEALVEPVLQAIQATIRH